MIDTRTQVGLTKEERRENVKGAFAGRKAQGKRDKNIILVDDVYTSGATMMEAAKVLKRLGAKTTWGLAVALG